MKFNPFLILLLVLIYCVPGYGQINAPYSATFVGKLGTDTVLVETYTAINNHLYGKAFVRVPEDYIANFSIHFYPDGSIREFNVEAMDPFNSSIPFKATSGAFEYRLNMNCKNDTCTYYNSIIGTPHEKVYKHPAKKMDFVGGWVPFISLMEWHCLRLAKSNQQFLPLHMINHNIGVYPIGLRYQSKDIVLFGGPFLDYTKIMLDAEHRIKAVDGTGTPWNYQVTKHAPINIEHLAARMAKTKGIGFPSGEDRIETMVKGSKIELSYGRPYKRGREIFGGIVPYDSIWRTGAGSPTIVSLADPIKIGNILIPKGKYSIYSIPRKNEWTLIFNQDLKTWPTDPNRSKDFAAITIPAKTGNQTVDQFTIEIVESKSGGTMKFIWDNVVAYAEFEVLKK